MSEWISVNDQLPEDGVSVDVFFMPSEPSDDPRRVPDCKIVKGVWMYWSEAGDHCFDPKYYTLDEGVPTHWMPLPSPPEDSQ